MFFENLKFTIRLFIRSKLVILPNKEITNFLLDGGDYVQFGRDFFKCGVIECYVPALSQCVLISCVAFYHIPGVMNVFKFISAIIQIILLCSRFLRMK